MLPWKPPEALSMAVLMPIISPAELSSGPPELPGLMAASVWITLRMLRPVSEGRTRPSALTTPVVRGRLKPYGLPMAIAISPPRPGADVPARPAAGLVDASQHLLALHEARAAALHDRRLRSSVPGSHCWDSVSCVKPRFRSQFQVAYHQRGCQQAGY